MIIRPEGFKLSIRELIDPHTFKSRPEALCWELFTQDAIDMLHGVRTFLAAPIVINDWHSGGQYEWSGYRSPGCTIGAPGSEHRKGNAFDLKVKGIESNHVKDMLKQNEDDPLLAKLMRIEDGTVGWTHVDCKTLAPGQSRIRIFKP